MTNNSFVAEVTCKIPLNMQHILKVLSFKLITLISFNNFNNNMLREDLNKFSRIMRFYKGSVTKRQTGQTASYYE